MSAFPIIVEPYSIRELMDWNYGVNDIIFSIMSHGAHWHAIHHEDEAILGQIRKLISEGRPPEIQPEAEDGRPLYRYLLGQESPLNAMAILKARETDYEFISAFPTMHAMEENELEVLSTAAIEDEECPEVEGSVTAITRDGTEITFFCPPWLALRGALQEGGRFIFVLGALAYSLELAPRTIEITEGDWLEREKKRRQAEDPAFDPNTLTSVSLKLDQLRTYLPRTEGDFEFQSVVEEVTPFSGLGTAGYLLRLNLAPDGSQPISIQLYATDKVRGSYEPSVGDPVRGVAWLQGVPMDRVEADDSWLDSAAAAHGSGHEALLAMASFAFGNPQLPIALQAIGGAIVGAGWTIVGLDDMTFVSWAPSIHAQRKGKDLWLFVRTAIKGFCEAPAFSVDRESYERRVAEQNIRCLWITVTLEAAGKNYAITAEGLEEFTDELQLPLELAKPEEFKVVSLGSPDRASHPKLEESLAAQVFADGINTLDLRGLSKLLVEDLEYTSQATKVRTAGRQTFLSFLGTKLRGWADKGNQVTAKTDHITVNGVSRPCAMAFDAQGKLITCTIFTGRKGHIAAMHTLSPQQVTSSAAASS